MGTQRRGLVLPAAPRASAPARRGPPPAPRASSLAALALALLAALPGGARPVRAEASALPPPAGEVLLVVAGAIDRPNVGAEAHLDRAHLESLPRARFETTTPWSEPGVRKRFEGVLLGALLDAVGARGGRVEAHGLDDYSAVIEGVDLARYPVIVADTEDGETLTLRRLGPLRIVFPYDDHPELRTQANMARAVWQLVRLDVR